MIEKDKDDKAEDQKVILLPFFTFRVAHIEERVKDCTVKLTNHEGNEIDNLGKLTVVTLIEVPYQMISNAKPFGEKIDLDSLIMSDANKTISKLEETVANEAQDYPKVV